VDLIQGFARFLACPGARVRLFIFFDARLGIDGPNLSGFGFSWFAPFHSLQPLLEDREHLAVNVSVRGQRLLPVNIHRLTFEIA